MRLKKLLITSLFSFLYPLSACCEDEFKSKTYINPIDIDYTYSLIGASHGLSYRSGADPAVINHKGEYFMFVTRSQGYWHSKNLRDWQFIDPENWYFEGSNAPAAWSHGDNVLALGNPSPHMSMVSVTDPKRGNWRASNGIINMAIRDPALFVDDDGKTYLYEGSSNVYPLLGVELDPENQYLKKGEPKELLLLHPERHGWERFGENHLSPRKPYTEGAWMTKHNGKYYLQYGAPGTQWNTYADGVYVGDHPLGPFKYADYNPVSYKAGGFAVGAGHGSTVKDDQGRYWHFATMRLSANYIMERRIGMFPAGFDEDGAMYTNTAYGDYPQYAPETSVKDHKNRFTGWMLLSYKKPVKASSVQPLGNMRHQDESKDGWQPASEVKDTQPENAFDENMRTFWLADTNGDEEWLEVDLQAVAKVKAVQVNYFDYNANILGRQEGLKHQFTIESSIDGISWQVAADYSDNERDQPHAYIELSSPVEARFIRYKNKHIPTQNLAISGFRVFGNGYGETPSAPSYLKPVRHEDKRNASLTWSKVPDALGYTLYWGIAEGKLNNSVMIYDNNYYELRALNVDQQYYYTVEAFNENGISERMNN